MIRIENSLENQLLTSIEGIASPSEYLLRVPWGIKVDVSKEKEASLATLVN